MWLRVRPQRSRNGHGRLELRSHGVADQARFLARDGCVAVGDARLPHERAELFARLEDIGNTSLTSLVHATKRLRRSIDEDVTNLKLYYGIPAESFWPRHWDALPVTISFFDEAQVRVSPAIQPERLLDEPGGGTFTPLMAMAERHGARVGSVGYPSIASRGRLEPSLTIPPRGRTVNDCIELAEDAALILEAVLAQGAFDHAAIADLVRAKRPDLVIGQRETSWFDAKDQPYMLSEDAQRYEFAKDVAAFANACGGLIVCGLRTRSDHQGDIVREHRPFDLSLVNRPTLQRVMRDWIHPTPVGVRIELIPTDGPSRGVMLIEIPRQPPQMLPLLVTRGELGGRLSTRQMTVPVRDGEDTDYASVGEIHALLVAGRGAFAALRGTGDEDDDRSVHGA